MKDNTRDGESPREFSRLGDVLPGLFPPELLPSLSRTDDATAPRTRKGRVGKSVPDKLSDKLAKAAAEIKAAPEDIKPAFLASPLVQCTLPHSDPGQVNGWKRSNGAYSLVLQPALDPKTMTPYGLPYGPLPRLLLLWIVTEAVRNKNSTADPIEKRTIKLGDSLNDFLRHIGLDPKTGGGKRGDAKRLKEQMFRLFRCRISFEYSETTGKQSWLDMQVAPKGEFWWDYKNHEQPSLFESYIVLGEDFYNAVTAGPVPFDLRALLPLKKSPLAIDLYTWTTYRVYTLRQARQSEIRLSMAVLQEQFGSEYGRLRDFKAAFADALAKVQEVYPELDYSLERQAFILRDGQRSAALKSKEKIAAQERLAGMRPFDQVSDRTRDWFRREHPGWDVEAAIQDFYTWREEKNQESGNTNAHFRAFAKTWVKRNL